MKLTLDIQPAELAELIGLFKPEPEPQPEPEVPDDAGAADVSAAIAKILGMKPEDVEVVQPQQAAKPSPWAVAKENPDEPLIVAGEKRFTWNQIPKDTRGEPSAYWMDSICPCGQKHGTEEDYAADTAENRLDYGPKNEAVSKEGDGGYL